MAETNYKVNLYKLLSALENTKKSLDRAIIILEKVIKEQIEDKEDNNGS